MFHKKYCLLTINIVLIVFNTSAQINNCTLQKNVFVEDFTFYSDKEYTSLDNILGGQIETSYIKNSKGASEGVNVTDGHCLVVTNGAEGGWWNKNPIRYGNTGNSGASEYGGFPAKDGFLVVNCDIHKGDMFTYILPQGSICSDSYYSFTADITNMNIPEPPKVRVPINVSFIVLGLPDEVELMNVNTGNIAETNKWHNCGGTFFSKGYKKFKLIIRNNYEAAQGETVVSGNDVGIDNIIFSQCMPEAKMFSDDADINGEVNICEPITEVYFNDSELKSFFSKPYYLLQTSKDGTNWNNYESATTSSRISINLIHQLNKTPYLYRVWAGGSIEAVSSSAQSGTPGECEMLTTVSNTIKIIRNCDGPQQFCSNPKVVFSEDFTFFSKDSCTALSNILDGKIQTDYDIDDPPADRTWTHYVIDGHCLVVNTAGAGGWWINNKPVRKGNTGNEGASVKEGLPEHDGFLLVNCANELGDMFSYTLPDQKFCPDTYYNFTADITNLGNDPASTAVPVNVSFIVMGLPGEVELLNVSSGDIKETSQWINVGGSFNAGNFTSFRLIIRNNILTHGQNGNDAGIDNIVFSGCIPDTKVTSGDADKDGNISKCATETTISYNDTDLRQYFTQPYYQLQMSTDGSSWQNVGEVTTTPTATIDMDSQSNKTPYYYRVWSGSNVASVTQSAATGQAGSCTDVTVVSKTMTITRSCEYTKSEVPEVDAFEECAGETAGGKLNLTTLVKAHKEKLTWYKAASGDEKLESTTVDISQPGVYNYYVTNTEPGYTKLESDRTEVTVTIKDQVRFKLDNTSIKNCIAEGADYSFNIESPVPADAVFDWYNGSEKVATGTTYTLENKESKGTLTIKASTTDGSACESSESVSYELWEPVSAEISVKPLAVYIGKTEAEIKITDVQGSGDYILYKEDKIYNTGKLLKEIDLIFNDADFTSEGFTTYKITATNGLCDYEDYSTIDVIKDPSQPNNSKTIEPMLFFTPNNDGLNDNWVVKNIEGYGYYSVEIYDRYHKCLLLVKDSFKPFSWDGTYNGHKLPNGDYWYIITVQEGDIRKQRSGHFILKK